MSNVLTSETIITDNSFAGAIDQVVPSQLAVKTYIGHENTKEPTGFKDPESVVVTYDSSARTITLTGTVEAYYRGVQVAALTSGWVSDAIPPGPTQGYFLYYDGANFVWSTTVWSFDTLHIAYVYYEPSGTFRFAVRETHGLMPWQAHRELHETVGTYLRSGGDLSSYALASSTAADRRPDVGSTVIADEDLQTTDPALTSKSYTHLYLTSTGTSTFTTANAEILPVTGATPYYNQFTGGNWVQTAVPPAQYTMVFLVAVPTSADAGSQTYRYLWLQGQLAGTLANAQAFDFHDMNIGQLSGIATEFVPIGKVILRNTGADWELTSVEKLIVTRVAASTAGGNYISSVETDTTLTGTGTPASPLGLSGTTPNTFTITNATITTSTTTGALVVTGGIGTGNGIYAGGQIVGSGPASDAGSIRSLPPNSTATSGTLVSMRADLSAAPTAASSAIYIGGYGIVSVASGNANNLTNSIAVNGYYGWARHSGTGTVTGMNGFFGQANNSSTGTVSDIAGIRVLVRNESTGVITRGYGVRVSSATKSGGTFTTNYGVFVEDQTAGTTNYAIYTNAGAVRFGDAVTTTATLTTGVYTVATLPTGAAGKRAFVSDANATTFASVVAGGGANGVPVYHDGTNWRIG